MMSRRQDHEEVVAAARNDMKHFDKRQALERWIQNYVSPTTICVPGQRVVVTKNARGWKVEHGLAEETEPYLTHYADRSAPQPPVMEIRPPKPEPVKPRFNVPPPQKVDSWARVMANAERMMMEATLIPAALMPADTATAQHAANQRTLTVEKLLQSIQDAGLVTSRPVRAADYYRDYDGPYPDQRVDAMRYMMQSLSPMKMPRHLLAGIDLASGPDLTSVAELKKPPPETSVRNK